MRHQFSFNMPFLSGQISAKCFESSDGRLLSIGMQYLRNMVHINACRQPKELTILHAACPSIASPATCGWQILGQPLARLHCPTQIRASHEKHIQYGWWRRVHHQCCGSHAVNGILMISCCRQKYGRPTSIVGSSRTWIDDEIESAIGNGHVPDREYPMGLLTCRPLGSLLCRRLFAKSKSSPHLPFQRWEL